MTSLNFNVAPIFSFIFCVCFLINYSSAFRFQISIIEFQSIAVQKTRIKQQISQIQLNEDRFENAKYGIMNGNGYEFVVVPYSLGAMRSKRLLNQQTFLVPVDARQFFLRELRKIGSDVLLRNRNSKRAAENVEHLVNAVTNIMPRIPCRSKTEGSGIVGDPKTARLHLRLCIQSGLNYQLPAEKMNEFYLISILRFENEKSLQVLMSRPSFIFLQPLGYMSPEQRLKMHVQLETIVSQFWKPKMKQFMHEKYSDIALSSSDKYEILLQSGNSYQIALEVATDHLPWSSLTLDLPKMRSQKVNSVSLAMRSQEGNGVAELPIECIGTEEITITLEFDVKDGVYPAVPVLRLSMCAEEGIYIPDNYKAGLKGNLLIKLKSPVTGKESWVFVSKYRFEIGRGSPEFYEMLAMSLDSTESENSDDDDDDEEEERDREVSSSVKNSSDDEYHSSSTTETEDHFT